MGKKAKHIMTREIITVPPDMRVNDLIELLIEHRISCAPVVDGDGELVGIVTKTDILGHFMDMDLDLTVRLGLRDLLDAHPDLEQMAVSADTQLTAERIMTPKPQTARENTPVEKLAERMLDNRIHRLIITKRKKLTGIVSTIDILRHVAGKKDR